MRFAFSDDQDAIRDAVEAFLRDAASGEATRAAMAGDGFDAALWRRLAGELGLTALIAPEAAGGSGLGMIEAAIVGEALGMHVAALPWIASAVIATRILATGGNDAQRAGWLPRLAAGDVATVAEGEFSADGDMLSGNAEFVPHGAVADVVIVRTGDSGWLIDPHSPGCTVTALASLDQARPLARLTLERAAAEPLPGLDWRALDPWAWTAIAADALGGARACLDRTVAYVGERVQFGRPVGGFQAVKHRLADMLVAIEQATSAVYWAAGAIDAGDPEARFAAHAAKSFACDTYATCAGNMIQLHGGIGFTWEHDAHLYLKRARANLTWLGTPAWHRERVAASMLGEASCG